MSRLGRTLAQLGLALLNATLLLALALALVVWQIVARVDDTVDRTVAVIETRIAPGALLARIDGLEALLQDRLDALMRTGPAAAVGELGAEIAGLRADLAEIRAELADGLAPDRAAVALARLETTLETRLDAWGSQAEELDLLGDLAALRSDLGALRADLAALRAQAGEGRFLRALAAALLDELAARLAPPPGA